MTENEYIKIRVDNQIDWYSNKSSINKSGFRLLRILEIVMALTIPFLSNLITPETLSLTHIVSLLGILIVLITGLISLFRLQENWIDYRAIAELIKSEKYLYITRSEPYINEGAFNLFVERIETLISGENSKWVQEIKKEKSEVPINKQNKI